MKTPTLSRLRPLFRRGALTLTVLALCPVLTSRAADIFWSGGTGDYTNAASWGGTVPGGGDHAINNSGSNNVIQINAGDPNWTVIDLIAGNADNTSGAYVQNGATVKVGNPGGWFRFGVNPGSFGIYTLNGGTLNSIDQLHVAEQGVAVLNINGGLLTKSGGQSHSAMVRRDATARLTKRAARSVRPVNCGSAMAAPAMALTISRAAISPTATGLQSAGSAGTDTCR